MFFVVTFFETMEKTETELHQTSSTIIFLFVLHGYTAYSIPSHIFFKLILLNIRLFNPEKRSVIFYSVN